METLCSLLPILRKTVVDVYSEWCGPCSAMLANLKKLKLEIGGDNLHLALAKSDGITCLERFRGRSEPTWMLISNGKMVNLMYGANAPKLWDLIVAELKTDIAARQAGEERGWEISEMAPEERVRYDVVKAIEDEKIRIQIEKEKQALLDRRTAVANVVLNNIRHNGVIVIFPQAKDLYKNTLADLWEPAGLAIAATEKPRFTEAMIEELLYFAETTFSEVDIVNLISEATFALFIKPTDPDEFVGDIDEAVQEFVYGEMKCPPGSPESPAQLLLGHVPVTKDIKEAVTAVEARESLADLAIPSMLSLSAMDTNLSKKKIQSKAELRSRLEIFSKIVVHSKEIVSRVSVRDGQTVDSEEEDEEFLDVTGIWAPPNAYTKATAIKLLFPKIYDPIALPEPVPTPPHIAIAFEPYRRKEITEVMNEYENAIMRYGYFTTDNPETAKVIAKSTERFDKLRVDKSGGERLVIQISRKRSEAWCVFSQLNPTFMSHSPEDGERDCKLFFPEGYDEPEPELVEEVIEQPISKPKKKGKKGKAADESETETSEITTVTGEEEEEEYGGEADDIFGV